MNKNYYHLYLKYKMKYLELKQHGGDKLNITLPINFDECVKTHYSKINPHNYKIYLGNMHDTINNIFKSEKITPEKFNSMKNKINIYDCTENIKRNFVYKIDKKTNNTIEGKYITASYVYSINKNKNIYISLVRKVPFGYRIYNNISRKKKREVDDSNRFKVYNKRQKWQGQPGAAGTKYQYHGKWTNLGGSIESGTKSWKDWAIKEILEESGIYITKYEEFRGKLELEFSSIKDNFGIFLFFIKDWDFFEYWYPPMKNYTNFNNKKFYKDLKKLMKINQEREYLEITSRGEIDRRVSLNTQQLLDIQHFENNEYNNNFLIDYFCKTFNNFIMKFLFTKYNKYKYKFKDVKLPSIKDKFINENEIMHRYGSRPARNYEGI